MFSTCESLLCGICRILDHPSVTMFSTCERLWNLSYTWSFFSHKCSVPVRGCGICRILDHPSVTMFSTCERLASKTLLMTAHVTALLTLLGLAVDHYLAICRPLYHRTDLNVSRVNIAVFVVWIASFSCCLLDIILPVKHHFFSCTVSGICSFTTAVKVVSYCIVRRYLWSERLCVCLSVRHTHKSR